MPKEKLSAANIEAPIWVDASARYTPEEWGSNVRQADILAVLDSLAANRGDNGEGTHPIEYILVDEGGNPATSTRKFPVGAGGRYPYNALVQRLTSPGASFQKTLDFYARHLVNGQPGPLSDKRTIAFKFPKVAGSSSGGAGGAGTETPDPGAPESPNGQPGEPYDVEPPYGMPSTMIPLRFNGRSAATAEASARPWESTETIFSEAGSRSTAKQRLREWADAQSPVFQVQYRKGFKEYRVLDEYTWIDQKTR